jgi:hypothetical protein
MKVHPLRTVLPPAQVREDVLLWNLARQPLNGGASMLLLARVDDRLRSSLLSTQPIRLNSVAD